MSVTRDILRAWRAPRAVMRDHLAVGVREDRALMFLMLGCFIIFVAQLPRLSRIAFLQDQDVAQLAAYEFFAWVMVWPLAFYGIAMLSHLAARLIGGQGDLYGARLALFWAILAATPAALLYGLMAGFDGQTAGSLLTGAIWLGGFVWIWLSSLLEAERPGAAP